MSGIWEIKFHLPLLEFINCLAVARFLGQKFCNLFEERLSM